MRRMRNSPGSIRSGEVVALLRHEGPSCSTVEVVTAHTTAPTVEFWQSSDLMEGTEPATPTGSLHQSRIAGLRLPQDELAGHETGKTCWKPILRPGS
jgi:hypothetical protein